MIERDSQLSQSRKFADFGQQNEIRKTTSSKNLGRKWFRYLYPNDLKKVYDNESRVIAENDSNDWNALYVESVHIQMRNIQMRHMQVAKK